MKKLLTFMLFITLLFLLTLRYIANNADNAATDMALPAETGGPEIGSNGYRVAVDPGHGGIDSGAIGMDTGVTEASLALKIGMLLENRFNGAGAFALMTRESGEVDYTGAGDTQKLRDMNNRARLVNGQDIGALISIHMNTFSDRSVHGAQVFYQQGSEKGQALASSIQDELNASINVGKNRTSQPGDYYLLKAVDCPAVIVECGFLSNPEDEVNLQNPQYQKKLIDSIYEGVCRFLNAA
jgi:N-acetylmuramoyl-L-alanine amidase